MVLSCVSNTWFLVLLFAYTRYKFQSILKAKNTIFFLMVINYRLWRVSGHRPSAARAAAAAVMVGTRWRLTTSDVAMWHAKRTRLFSRCLCTAVVIHNLQKKYYYFTQANVREQLLLFYRRRAVPARLRTTFRMAKVQKKYLLYLYIYMHVAGSNLVIT